MENSENEKLVYAWWAMCRFSGSSKKRDKVSAKEYEEIRKMFSSLCSQKYSGKGNPMYGSHRYGKEAPTYRKIWTNEERKNASDAQRKSYQQHPERWNRPEGFMSGNKNPMYGKHHTDETRKRMSEIRKQKIGILSSRARKVNQYTRDGEFIKTWDYIKQAAEELHIHTANISRCCRGKGKIAGGFKWSYYNEQLAQ